jgi:hypothetical protein
MSLRPTELWETLRTPFPDTDSRIQFYLSSLITVAASVALLAMPSPAPVSASRSSWSGMIETSSAPPDFAGRLVKVEDWYAETREWPDKQAPWRFH